MANALWPLHVTDSLRTIELVALHSRKSLMRISPSLLLLMLVIFVFTPSIQEWVTQGGAAWHRPYQLWLAVVVFVFWNQRRSEARRASRPEDNHPNEF